MTPVLIRTLPVRDLPEQVVAPLLDILDEQERARASRFAFARSRVEFIAAHALTRATLAALGGAPPRAWRFAPAAHGKPVALLGGQPAPVSFSLSHTGGMVGVAAMAAPGALLGFDLESLARTVSARVARNVFRPEELAWLASLPAERRGCGFLRLWTLKEAFIKATGRGIGQDLSTFWFELPPPRIRFTPALTERPEAWRFEQLVLEGGFLGAVGLRSPGEAMRVSWQPCDLPALLRELGLAG